MPGLSWADVAAPLLKGLLTRQRGVGLCHRRKGAAAHLTGAADAAPILHHGELSGLVHGQGVVTDLQRAVADLQKQLNAAQRVRAAGAR